MCNDTIKHFDGWRQVQHNKGVDRLERTVVQLVEARRLMEFDDVPHGRLALLLLDNAAETMLMQRAKESLDWADWYGGLLKQLEQLDANNDEVKLLREEIEAKTVSDRTRQRLEQDFDDLARFVFSLDDCHLDPEFVACLKALHRYRNDAYHRDFVREDVLRPANDIYFYLCCHLLKDQKFTMGPIAEAPAIVIDVFGDRTPTGAWPPGLFSTEELGDAVADELLSQSHLDHTAISLALSAHLVGRIDALDKDLDEFIDYLGFRDKAATLRSIQLVPLGSEIPDDFWSRPLIVTEKAMRGWRTRAAGISRMSSAQDALRLFDNTEASIAELEAKLEPFTIAMDREIQHKIDELRGK